MDPPAGLTVRLCPETASAGYHARTMRLLAIFGAAPITLREKSRSWIGGPWIYVIFIIVMLLG